MPYINPGVGKDTNLGTIGSPWNSLAPAVAQQGSAFFLAEGTNLGHVLDPGSWTGVSGFPITITAYPSGVYLASRPLVGVPGDRGMRLNNTQYANILGLATVPGCTQGVQLFGSTKDCILADCLIQETSDSGILDSQSQGSNAFVRVLVVRSGTIGNVGYGVHGFYLKAPNDQCIDCTTVGTRNSGFSVRMAGARIEGCRAYGGCGIGLSYFGQGTVDGVVTVTDFVAEDCTGRGLYLSSQEDHGAKITFEFRNVRLDRSHGIDVAARAKDITVWENVTVDGVQVPKP